MTNKRIIIRTGAFKKTVEWIFYNKLSDIRIYEKLDKSGTIVLVKENIIASMTTGTS